MGLRGVATPLANYDIVLVQNHISRKLDFPN